MKDRIQEVRQNALSALEEARDEKAVADLAVRFLGRKGEVSALLREVSSLPVEVRPEAGQLANILKKELSSAFEAAEKRLAEAAAETAGTLDVTLPGRRLAQGRFHPLTQVCDEICRAFVRMGFSVVEGPEVEADYYNFEALN
ncbi:MAG: phenylalanine--tRNA ligase subunit alpha, partial [Pseudomonadota bacterium]